MTKPDPLITATARNLNRIKDDHTCPLCSSKKFKSLPYFAVVPVSESIKSVWDTKAILPLVIIQCENCGMTSFVDHNLALNADTIESENGKQ